MTACFGEMNVTPQVPRSGFPLEAVSCAPDESLNGTCTAAVARSTAALGPDGARLTSKYVFSCKSSTAAALAGTCSECSVSDAPQPHGPRATEGEQRNPSQCVKGE